MFPFPFSFLSGAAPDVPVDRIANAEAMSFNGTDQYVSAGDTTYLNNLSQMTLSIWFNLDVAVQNKGLIGDYYGSNTGHFGLSTKQISGNNYSLRTLINGEGNRFDITGSPFTSGQWHNLVMVFNAGTLNFYIDGQTAAFSIYSGSIPSSLSSDNKDLTIGRRDTLYWDGKIDEVAVFNTALSANKIQQIYDATAVVNGVTQTANLFTGGLDTSLVYWNRMGDS